MTYLVRKAKDSFDGIINFFTVNHVNVSEYFSASGSVLSGWADPSILFNYSNEGTSKSESWHSAQNDPVVTFTLKCPILLTHYRLRSRKDDNFNHPVSWKVEGLMLDSTWTTIDTKTDQTGLTSKGASYTYKCDKSMTVKQIKITGTKSTNNMYLTLSRVEFFGSMNLNQCPLPLFYAINGLCNTCMYRRTTHTFLFVMILIS